jgi:hypothetical protein
MAWWSHLPAIFCALQNSHEVAPMADAQTRYSSYAECFQFPGISFLPFL